MSADDNKLYKILDINPDATSDEIKLSYRKLAAKYHPDKGGDVTGEKFAEVSKAYKTLFDPVERKKYDNTSRLEIMAKQNIAQAIGEFINKCIERDEDPYNPVEFSKLVDHFKDLFAQEKKILGNLKSKKNRLVKMKGRVKLVACDDVYNDTLRKIRDSMNRDIEIVLANIELFEKINELLQDYDSGEKENPQLGFYAGQITSGLGRSW